MGTSPEKCGDRSLPAETEKPSSGGLTENEYIVEAIKKHSVSAEGRLKFRVKWEGWEKPSDMTWEPEENLENCIVLQQYFERVGGRKKLLKTSSLKKREIKHLGRGAVLINRVKEQKPKGSIDKRPYSAESNQWKPPAGSWEDDVASIDYCVPVDSGGFLVYILWRNGVQTRHHTSVIYKRCPQLMLQFFEKHVKFDS